MIRRIRVGYIGFSLSMLEQLLHSPFFELEKCIAEKGKISEQFRALCAEYSIGLFEVNSKKDMNERINCSDGISYFIMYESGIIIDVSALRKIHIYNFHPGSFIDNRGANPIIWSILAGDTFAEMTVHEIDETIDGGTIIDTRAIKISEHDNASSLKTKIEETIPELLVSLYDHILKHEYFKKNLNQYRRRVTESDYTIDLDQDSAEQIIRKTQSQSMYSGAVLPLDNEKIRIKYVRQIKQEGRVLERTGDKCYIEIRQVLEAAVHGTKKDEWGSPANDKE